MDWIEGTSVPPWDDGGWDTEISDQGEPNYIPVFYYHY